MKYDKRIRVEAVQTMGPVADSIHLLDWTPDTKQREAVLVVRPVLYLPRDLAETSRWQFGRATLRMRVDGLDLIKPAPVDEFICPEVDEPPRKRPFVFRHVDPTFFSAHVLDEKTQQAFMEPIYGVFFGNQSTVTVLLENVSLEKALEVRLKLVAAQYLCVGNLINLNAPESTA